MSCICAQVEEHVKQWVERYTENYAQFSALAESVPASTSQFPNVYHTLIHSHVLNSLLQLEHTYTIAIDDICKARDNALSVMQRRWVSGQMGGRLQAIHKCVFYFGFDYCLTKTIS